MNTNRANVAQKFDLVITGAPDDPILRSLCVVKRGGGGSHFLIYSAILCLYAGTPNSRSSCCSGVSEGAGASGAAGSSGAAALAAFGAGFDAVFAGLFGGALWRGACFSSSGGSINASLSGACFSSSGWKRQRIIKEEGSTVATLFCSCRKRHHTQQQSPDRRGRVGAWIP